MSADIEIEGIPWKPVKGRKKEELFICFVDGVMRLETGPGDEEIYSLAAGCVALRTGRVNTEYESFVAFRIKRGLRISSEEALGLLSGLELEVLWEVADLRPELLIKDGPLPEEDLPEGIPVLGYIKDIQRLYIPEETRGILGQLREGMRTPIFRIEEGHRSKLSWFIGLSKTPGERGIARVEVQGGVDIDLARDLADLSAGNLYRFRSDPLRDQRYPQNLLPVGWLERRLRSLIGDARIIRRTLLTSQGPR